MKKTFKGVIFLGILVILSISAFSKEHFINAYEYWAQFESGSFVTVKIRSQIADVTQETWKTLMVKQVTPEKVTIELKEWAGKENRGAKEAEKTPGIIEFLTFDFDSPPWAADDLFSGSLSINLFNPSLTSNAVQCDEGIEIVEINGVKYNAEYKKIIIEGNEIRTTMNVWFNDSIPGKVLRFTREIAGTVFVKEEYTAVEFKTLKRDASEYQRLLSESRDTQPASTFLWRSLRFFSELRRIEDDWFSFPKSVEDYSEWMERLERLVENAEKWEEHFEEDMKKIDSQLNQKEKTKLDPFFERADEYCTVFCDFLSKLYEIFSGMIDAPENISLDVIYKFEELKTLIDEWKAAFTNYAAEREKLKDINLDLRKN
ncbi:MAG: hypothetical protein WBC02_11300 [Candidatus Aminicenantaceae bacterium]